MNTELKRLFDETLMKWKHKGMNKPMMVIGVRQIGKTHTITKFCKENFDELIYFDLEENKEVRDLFTVTIDPDYILEKLEVLLKRKIDLEKTIFFFDEVHVSEEFIVSLKYFCQSEKPFKIICAGSLLGVKINRFKLSFPVGKIDMAYMYPMNFEEFLMACNERLLIDEIKRCYCENEQMAKMLHSYALDLYRKFLCVGGMPEAVKCFVDSNMDIILYDKTIPKLLTDMYLADMSKYTFNKPEIIKNEKAYKNIVFQLGKESNRKFIYKNIDSGASKRKFESAIDWLVASGMVIRCNCVEKIMKPLRAYENVDMFKLYISDIGMLASLSELDFSDILLEREFIYKGAITENYVACELRHNDIRLNYWHSGNSAEIDFLLYNADGIIPIEVKAGDNTKSQSLKIFINKYHPTYSIRISTKNFGLENRIKSVPLYAVFCIKK